MSCWIFVINDTDKVFEKRIKEEQWPIFRRTQNRTRLKTNDKVIFYKAGKEGQKFLGSATIGSELKKVSIFESQLRLTSIDVWEKPVAMNEVINDLDFIKNKNSWGNHFQGGVRAITKKEFDVIESVAK